MKKNKKISEKYIINNYLKKLNFKKEEAFDFNNDAAFLKIKKNKQLVVTNDTIIESVDFFKNDPPESIANKIVTCNLSDISSMGSSPYSYTLSLCLPNYIKDNWLKKFTKKLKFLQKKYNFFLIGGDISKSDKIIVSSNFFGYSNKGKILKRNGAKINDDIWITGNIGDSSIGLKIRQKKIKINYLDKKYFLNKYLYPLHCSFGNKIFNYATSAIDVSDGFYGDLSNVLQNKKFGASIKKNLIPFSNKVTKLIKNRLIKIDFLLSSGDDYELIFTANPKNSSIIRRISKKNNIKVTKVGKIIRKKGLYLDNKKIKIINKSFDHFA
tara:strand:+ start:5095 stop:6069 length:975 start_codon:yes stop_codon:yes gene_type:complete